MLVWNRPATYYSFATMPNVSDASFEHPLTRLRHPLPQGGGGCYPLDFRGVNSVFPADPLTNPRIFALAPKGERVPKAGEGVRE